MGTILGVEAPDGAVLAADRTYVDEESGVRRTLDRTFEYDDAAATAVGSAGGIEEFGRQLGSKLDRYRTDRGSAPTIDAVASTAGQVAKAAKVEAIVLARDDDGAARTRSVRSDGATFDDETTAFGSGAPVALGRLEDADLGDDLDAVEELLRDVLSSVAERDPETGGEVDTVRFANEPPG